jgi:hypothetical protein
MQAFRHRAGDRRAPAAGNSRQGVVELTMNGLFNRGNLILGISWAMALSVFIVHGGRDVRGVGASKAPHAPAAQLDAAVPAAAVIAPTSAVPDEALSRNDATRTVQ